MNKSFIYLFVIIIVCVPALKAQSPIVAQPGIKLGLNYASFIGKDSEGYYSRAAVLAGVNLRFRFSDEIALQTEINFTMKGSAEDIDVTQIDSSASAGSYAVVTYRIHYLELPVLMYYRLKVMDKDILRPVFFAGPAIGLKISSTRETTYGSADISSDLTDIKGMELSTVFGLGLEVNTGDHSSFDFELRYNLGLTKIDESYDNINYRLGVFSLIIGYTF